MTELDFSQYPEELLKGLSPVQIIELRKIMAGNLSAQNRLAPIDHRMFTRDAVSTEGPLALAIGAASPFYQLSKMQFGPHSTQYAADAQTSQPSWAQLIEGYKGLGEGLEDWIKSKRARNPLE